MPKNTKTIAIGTQRKQIRNARLQAEALQDTEAIFGRAVKGFGNGMFSVVIADQEHPDRIREVTAAIAGRSIARIFLNDIVVVAPSGKRYEIMGSMSAKNVEELGARIHPAILNEGAALVSEAGFEFDRGEIDVEAI
jgi:translation initiation factor IF-1